MIGRRHDGRQGALPAGSLRRQRCGFVLAGALAAAAPAEAARTPTVQDLRSLSLEELATLEVTSVSRRAEPLNRAPAAIYVITGEQIRRSGAVSLPEALRLAPNLQVGRLDALSYTISARGFNTFQASNKLLVLFDGRSVYSPLHAGVFWDQQQLMLDDVDRIEVISGPGGTLWGANAVNGVINVIGKDAAATQGGLATGRLGTVDHDGALRYGGRVGDNGAYRVYGLGFERGNSLTPQDGDGRDDWRGRQGGFRADWAADGDAVTLQGDLFDHPVEGGANSGGNLLARWTRSFAGGSELQLQAYYDKAVREVPGAIDLLETVDATAQYSFSPWTGHAFVLGGGHRRTEDRFEVGPALFVLQRPTDTVELSNLYLQDSIELGGGLQLTLGSKVEHSSYTGTEHMPSARLAWQASDTLMLWSAVSRAVRTPSRIDRELLAAGLLQPASNLQSEELVAYEVGYRGQPTPATTLSVSLYYHDYDDLRVLTVDPGSGLLTFGNRMHGHVYGLEAWGTYALLPWWHLSAGFNLLRKSLEREAGAVELALSQHVGNDPEHQASLRSSMDLPWGLELDLGVRYVDDLPDPPIRHYVAFDARLGWRATESLDLSIAGFNLLDDRHPESGDLATRREVGRSIHVGGRWRF